MFLIENLSNKIGNKIAITLNLDKDSEEVMVYGAFNLLQILWSTLWIVVFGTVLKVLMEALIIFFTISALRKYSGGVHASSPGICTIVGTVVSVGFALIIDKLYWIFNITNVSLLAVISLIFSYYAVYKLAPVDSIAKPIVKLETKKQFKRKSIVVVVISCIIVLVMIIFYFKYKNIFLLNSAMCICVGDAWQAFTLTNIGHKILTKLDNILKKLCKEVKV
ncbi:accessory gene regulator AgrB [Clostridium carboxidivorans P7]|uniref:Accessory gene regulator B n=1 Tax=Clostridium carboxidivorans P7 TaxID=536227 RepID=C6Q1S3_9CLOT|nr:accessory gene regulator B family protein [Clostridium carboxidivorans]AKN29304.1 accessory gene regulator AgrB [Clostridium carboxidivorans P7]EET84566.1 Accessory gene regulator B [Clostridium carboxidivorans P7]EFG89789.1 accessory protein regulator protein B [Clostridium carboxidivorans P7]